jgi:hypothetical protein
MRALRLPVALALTLVLAATALAKPYLRKPRRGIQRQTAPYTVGPGEDREWCQYWRADVAKPIDVSGFKVRMPEGAHHFVIWSYGGQEQDDTKFPQGPVESVGCIGLMPDELTPRVLIPLQSPNARFRMPKGIALRVTPGQQLWLNPHLKNPGTEPITPDVRFNLYAAKPGTVKHYAEGMIIGNMLDIAIPARGEQTLTAEWTAPVDLNLVLLTTHQHRLGTYANIELVSADGASTEVIYENFRWEHPRNFWPKGTLRLEKGRKMRITCQWKNPGERPVAFGPNTTDEMCFILGFYYRDEGDTEPVGFGQCLPSNDGLLCPLAPAVR